MLNKESKRLSPQMMKFVYLLPKNSLCTEYGVRTWRGNWRQSCI